MNSIFYTDEGEGTPVVFIHGFCETHEIWNDFVIPLKKKFRILTIDLPGFGESPLPAGDVSINTVGALVIDWMKGLNLTKSIIVGHSLGGYVALSMANQNPSLLAGFVLFHSTAYADTEEKKINRNRVIDFVEKNGVPPYIETFVPGLFHQKNHQSIPQVLKITLSTRAETLIVYAKAMRDRPEMREVLRNFEAPIMIIAGRKDSLIPLKSLEEQMQLIQKPMFTQLENSGHMGMFEQQNESHNALIEFVTTCNY